MMMMDTSSGYLKWILQVERKGREGKGREGTENERWMYGIAAGISFTVINNAATLWNRNLISYLQISLPLPGVQLIPKLQTKQLCTCWYELPITTHSHHSSARYCIHKVSHSYPRRTRFPPPSRSCFLIPTCQGITQAVLPPALAHHSRDLLHWATQESEAATRPTMTCNNAITKHTAMSPSGHAKDFLCVDLALSLAPAQDNMHATLYPLLRECHSHVARCRWRGVG